MRADHVSAKAWLVYRHQYRQLVRFTEPEPVVADAESVTYLEKGISAEVAPAPPDWPT